jgi:hypothetical protein
MLLATVNLGDEALVPEDKRQETAGKVPKSLFQLPSAMPFAVLCC